MNFARTIYFAICVILIEVQTGSHSQYYPSHTFQDDYLPPPRSYEGSPNYFNRRNIDPPYRQHVRQSQVVNDYDTGGANYDFFRSSERYAMNKNNRNSNDPRKKCHYPEYNYTPRHFGSVRVAFNRDNVDVSVEDTDLSHTFRVNRGQMDDPLLVVIYRPSWRCQEDHRIYREDGRCYESLSNGPCGELMKFYPEVENEIYGDCNCILDNGVVARPLTYWRPHDRCYLLYHRGPCGQGHWLILDECDFPTCAPRPPDCLSDDNETSRQFKFLHKGKCYETGQPYVEFCSDSEIESNFSVHFDVMNYGFKCMKNEPVPLSKQTKGLAGPPRPLKCLPGWKLMQNGRCKKKGTFDDDY